MANREYKDSLFRRLFREPPALYSLYGAIHPGILLSAEDIHPNTLDSILMDRIKNDISFLAQGRYIVLFGHQSTWSLNIPLRCLWYASELYRHMIPNKKAMYREKLLRIPAPQFFVFYIGDNAKPDKSTLRLSDAFLEPSDCMELSVAVFNITYDASRPILKNCPLLHDYSFFVNEVEKRKKEQMPSDEAIRQAMDHCSGLGILSEFIHDHYEEVFNMVTLWYDENEAREYWREEAFEDGLEQGLSQGRKQGLSQGLSQGRSQGRESTALNMLRDNMSISAIQKYTLLPEERILELAKQIPRDDRT